MRPKNFKQRLRIYSENGKCSPLLTHLIPVRLHSKGIKPTLRTKELGGSLLRFVRYPMTAAEVEIENEEAASEETGNKPKFKWTDKLEPATDEDKRKLIAKVRKVAVRTIFSHHVYKFGGKFYRQTEGGPIGLRLTGVVAQLVMDRWAKQFLKRLSDAGITVQCSSSMSTT